MSAPDDRPDNDHAGSEQLSGNKSKVTLITLLALITFVSLGQNIKRSSYTPLIATYNVSATTGVSDSSSIRAGSSSNVPKRIPARRLLPIYLLESSTNRTAVSNWGNLAKQWDRTTQYEDIFMQSTIIPSLPQLHSAQTRTLVSQYAQPRRIVVMIHCGPKTGSTTLRKACKDNLKKTCGVVNPPGHHSREPEGYMDESKLFPLIRRCTRTSHFCAKEVTMPDADEVPVYEDVNFIHMFPFRNYEEWASSALKQQYDRGAEKGCNRTKSILEECKDNNMELDFRKYSKTELSKFKDSVLPRMNELEEDHMFLLYHHRELNDVLDKLNEVYGVPSLPGSDGKGKEKRPEGTCDEKLLDMFHDCFSSGLMELP